MIGPGWDRNLEAIGESSSNKASLHLPFDPSFSCSSLLFRFIYLYVFTWLLSHTPSSASRLV